MVGSIWLWKRGEAISLSFGDIARDRRGGSNGPWVATAGFSLEPTRDRWPHLAVRLAAETDGANFQNAFATRRVCAQACYPVALRAARDLLAGGGTPGEVAAPRPGVGWRRATFSWVEMKGVWARTGRVDFHVQADPEDPEPQLTVADRKRAGEFLKAAAEHLHGAVHADEYRAFFRDR